MSVAARAASAAVTFGSDRGCDWWVALKTVSSEHARLVVDDDGALRLEDLDSTNGTFVRGERVVPGTPVVVSLGERISLGKGAAFVLAAEHVAPLLEPTLRQPPQPLSLLPGLADTQPVEPTGDPRARAASAPRAEASAPKTTVPVAPVVGPRPGGGPAPAPRPPSGVAATMGMPAVGGIERPSPAPRGDAAVPSAPLGAVSISLGYDASNDVQFPHAHISGRHARLYRVGERYVLEDQGSTNGTWVGNKRVERAYIEPGQQFALGVTVVTFDAELVARLGASRAAVPRASSEGLEAGRELVVGRAADCDLQVSVETVSSRHAAFRVLEGGRGYALRDLGSLNGTYLNSREHRVDGEVAVGDDDVVFLGTYRLPVGRLPLLVTADATARAAATGRRFVVGRDASCDVVLDAAVVSARHAEVVVTGDATFTVRDLGSSNGTFVNGLPIRGVVTVGAGDRVSFGGYEAKLDAAEGVVRRAYRGDIVLQAERVSMSVPDGKGTKRVLDDISFTAYPTEFVGLMGPSGAGKTTLMLALAGFTRPTEGQSRLNGLDLYESYNAFRGSIGYVPQDDIVYPQLTVYESLYFTARLRLPPDTTRDEIDRTIHQVLRTLEIGHTRDTRIGDAIDKGISGGERKRVNLAQELMTEPSLLFLDEPTSGLASEDTLNVMRLLRGLADGGRTILLTIHQPSLEAYRLMDNVLYLVKGSLVYYGPAHPDSILYFHPEVGAGAERDKLLADPGSAMKPLAEEQRTLLDANDGGASVRAFVGRRRDAYQASRYHRSYVEERREPRQGGESGGGATQRLSRRGVLRQWWLLSQRAALIKWKDRVNTAILLAQAPVIGAILWAVFAADLGGSAFDALRRGPAALFLLVASAVWFGCSNAAREIVGERGIYRRERMVNLMISAYTLSKLTVLGGVCALQCLLLLGIVYVPLGLSGSFATMYAALLLSSLAGLGVGLTLSALVRSQEAAMALVPLTLIPQIILGGVIMPVHEMNPATRLLASLTATRWGQEAMLHAEYGDDTLASIRERCGIPACTWGAGATGFAFTYYPSDPDDTTQTEQSAGVDAVVGGQVPYVEPADDPTCVAFCAALQRGNPVTPLDVALGPDGGEPLRAQAWADVAVAGHAMDQAAAAGPTFRVGLGRAMAVLAAMVAFFGALVASLLRWRDVEVG